MIYKIDFTKYIIPDLQIVKPVRPATPSIRSNASREEANAYIESLDSYDKNLAEFNRLNLERMQFEQAFRGKCDSNWSKYIKELLTVLNIPITPDIMDVITEVTGRSNTARNSLKRFQYVYEEMETFIKNREREVPDSKLITMSASVKGLMKCEQRMLKTILIGNSSLDMNDNVSVIDDVMYMSVDNTEDNRVMCYSAYAMYNTNNRSDYSPKIRNNRITISMQILTRYLAMRISVENV